MPDYNLLRVAIDGNEGNVENRVGSNTYAFELLKELEQLTRNDSQFEFTVLHTDPLVSGWPSQRTGWKYTQVPAKKFATQWAYPLYLHKHRKEFDLLYVPGHYAPRLCPIPYINTVMDLAYLHYPKQFKSRDYLQLKHWTSYSVKKAKHVTAISQFTKQEIATLYHVPFHKITVIPPGFRYNRPEKNSGEKALNDLGIQDPYILYVGTIQPRKNLIRLVEAFENACVMVPGRFSKSKKSKKSSNTTPYDRLNLVIAGKAGWLSDPIMRRIGESKFRDRIKLLGYISDEQKTALYSNASCVCLVGLYEGFGIPALEAIAYRKIPVVSNTSSLPEVVGKGGILVDPTNVSSIARGIVDALTLKQQQRKKMIQEGKQQLLKYTWHHSALALKNTLLQNR